MPSPAFLELQRLLRLLTEELATFRRRAIQSEGRVRELEQALADASASSSDQAGGRAEAAGGSKTQVAELERENAMLRQRLDGATERTRQLLDRVRFLRQQQEQEATR